MDTAHASDNKLSLFLSKAVIIYLAMQNTIMFWEENSICVVADMFIIN